MIFDFLTLNFIVFTALIIIIFLSVLIIVHELGHFLLAKKFGVLVEEFGIGLPPKIFSRKKGETTYSVNALPIGGFVKILGENREEETETENAVSQERIFYNLKIWKRFLIISGGVAMNFILGWLLVSLIFAVGIPKAVIITQVMSDGPAEKIGIKTNDKVIGFSDVNEFVGFINQHRGEIVPLRIERGKEELTFEITPRKNPPKNEGALGVALVEAGQERLGILKSVWEGLKTSAEIFSIIFIAIFNLLKMAILGKASLEGIAGPVGIVKITNQASQMGLVYLIQLLALISINLAAINIFPFPALDGGRLLFLIIEKITGKPLPKRFEQYVNAVGFVFLILLMALVTIKDIGRLF